MTGTPGAESRDAVLPPGVVESSSPSVSLMRQPLLPPQWAGTPGPAIAATMIRHGALDEDEDAREADLSQLAAKLKVILDEEARRHGIDV